MENNLITLKDGKMLISSLELLKEINLFREQSEDKAKLEHKDLLKIIRNEFEDEINGGEISPVEYKDRKGENRPMFELTTSQAKQILARESKVVRKALIAHIEKLEDFIRNQKPQVQSEINRREETMYLNAKTRQASLLFEMSKAATLSTEYGNILIAKATEILTNESLFPLPTSVIKTLTAAEVGEALGISSQKVGRLTNKHGLKTDRYGQWYRDKSPNSNKEVDTFRYYPAVIPKLQEILNCES